MKCFSPKQVVLIKGIFDFSEGSSCYVSSDRTCINAYVGNYQFYFHVCEDYIYYAIYKYDDEFEHGECVFRQYYDDFYSIITSLHGFLLNHNCNS